MIQRQVQQIHPKVADERFGASMPFSAYLEQPNIVLLGDPGAGKTHLFKTTALQTNGRFMTVRQFLNVPADWANDTIFIDALDERRAGRGDDSVIDALVQKLFANPPDRVRISCRDRDWLGESDLEAFQPYFGSHGGAVVVTLRALTPEDQREILSHERTLDVESFLSVANERGMEEFLHNPQNLLMLADVVESHGDWPSTRVDLFKKSTALLLSERNPTHLRKDTFGHEDLRATAGALCALRLISDVAGLSVDEQTVDPAYPGFASIPFLDSAKVKAALRRPVFVSAGASASVDYVHRTTAEFLAAEWIAGELNNGLSLRRVAALLGMDGHPASELRGLHSWLPVFAPKFADILIEADPYGVLVYGDVSALAPSSRVNLLNALGRLSASDPWFRADHRSRERLAGLCGPEMTTTFKAVLTAAEPNHSLRHLVLETMLSGRVSEELMPDVASVLVAQDAWLSERSVALEVLAANGSAAARFITSAYFEHLSWEADEFHLRAQAISALYGKGLGASDVIDLLTQLQEATFDVSNSVDIWTISQTVPIEDIGRIFDGVAPLPRDLPTSRAVAHNASKVCNVLTKLLIQALDGLASLSGTDLWKRLEKLASYHGPSALATQLRVALQSRKTRVLAALDEGIKELSTSSNAGQLRYGIWTIFQGIVTGEELSKRLAAQFFLALDTDSNVDASVIYECALSTMCDEAVLNLDLFDLLYAQGERPELKETRDRSLMCQYPSWQTEQAMQIRREQAELRENRAKRVQNLKKCQTAIRNGSNLSWLAYIAQVYLGSYWDSEVTLQPHERLIGVLEEEGLATALAGLSAVLDRADLPGAAAVGERNARGHLPEWWLAVIAGLDERWTEQPTLSGLSDDLLATALAINVVYPTTQRQGNTMRSLQHGWVNAAKNERPELVRDTYVAVATAGLDARQSHVCGLHELWSMPELARYRSDVGLDLLRRFPDSAPSQLQQLLECASSAQDNHCAFLDLVRTIISPGHSLGHESHLRWLVAAFVVAPSEFEAEYLQCAKDDFSAVWLFRDFSFPADGPSGTKEQRVRLTVEQRERIVLLVGQRFENAPHPSGGWSGNQNPWDASEFLQKMVNRISAESTAAATASLERLLSHEFMASYRDFILHALANQRARRRDAEFRQPDWLQTIATLSNGAPANAADLHALLFDTLIDISGLICHANNDIYKQFWNEEGNGRVTTPKSEESCRHVLVGMLRDRLGALKVSIEPEGHMADGKRADIVVSFGLIKIPVELKRNYHAEVWTAAQSQLDSMYTADPAASGYGIYGIFWFGGVRARKMPLHPTLKTRPTSADSMSEMLEELVPVERRSHISIVVIDLKGSTSAEA